MAWDQTGASKVWDRRRTVWAVARPTGWRWWHINLSRGTAFRMERMAHQSEPWHGLQDGEWHIRRLWHGLQDGEDGTSAWDVAQPSGWRMAHQTAVARPAGWRGWHICFALWKHRIQILALRRHNSFIFATLMKETVVKCSDTLRCVVVWLMPDVSKERFVFLVHLTGEKWKHHVTPKRHNNLPETAASCVRSPESLSHRPSCVSVWLSIPQL